MDLAPILHITQLVTDHRNRWRVGSGIASSAVFARPSVGTALWLLGVAVAMLHTVPARAGGNASCTAHDAASAIVQRSGGDLENRQSAWVMTASLENRNFFVRFVPAGECSSTWYVGVQTS